MDFLIENVCAWLKMKGVIQMRVLKKICHIIFTKYIVYQIGFNKVGMSYFRLHGHVLKYDIEELRIRKFEDCKYECKMQYLMHR